MPGRQICLYTLIMFNTLCCLLSNLNQVLVSFSAMAGIAMAIFSLLSVHHARLIFKTVLDELRQVEVVD